MKIAVLAALSSVICVGTSLAGSGNRAVVEVRPGMDVQRTLDEAAEDLMQLVLEVASGRQTKAEEKNYREISIFKDGVVL